jgi:hypothetical protein
MPEEAPKEVVEFLARFGGANTAMVEQLILEWWWSTNPGAQGKFPFTRPEIHMPMYHEIIVAGLQLPPWLIGMLVGDDAKKKGDTKTADAAKIVEMIGEGGVFYATGELEASTIVHNTPLGKGTSSARAGQDNRAGQDKQPAALVYKL